MPPCRTSLPAFTRQLKAHILSGDFNDGPHSYRANDQQMLNAGYRDAFSSHAGAVPPLSDHHAVTATLHYGA
ncbi:MAG: hypothetical protein P8126_01395 [Gammaproteobacteria bacterium]|jgi:endonuclease/exonuclease/phosphatase family metal-dependent hydrolase